MSRSTEIEQMVLRAMVDERLSTKARGLFGHIAMTYGDENIPGAVTLSKVMDLGRDVIRALMNDLEAAGYLERDNYAQKGTGQMVWITRIARRAMPWDSGTLHTASSSTESGLVTSDNGSTTSTSHNDNSSVANAPSELCATAAPRAGDTARDLAREFHTLMTTRTQAIGQVNFGALGSNIARWRREGATPEQVRQAMRIFFDDPRNVAKAGRGLPLWKVFVAWFPQNQRLVADLTNDPWREINEQVEKSGSVLLVKKRRGY